MKYLATAMALVLASPLAAQTAPAAAQHQGHDQMQMPMEHHAGHAEHQGAQHRDGCCQDRNGNGVMDCCEHDAAATEQRDCCAEGADQPSAQQQDHHDH